MTDEWTPEEQEALRKLPRERMPSAGLEDRVAGALRERCVLSQRRRRVVAITGTRVAGLLAACVALVIGAYSIGLQRGAGDQVIPPMTAIDRLEHVSGLEKPASETPAGPAEGVTEAERGGRVATNELDDAERSLGSSAYSDAAAAPEDARNAPPTGGDKGQVAEKKETRAETPMEPTALAQDQTIATGKDETAARTRAFEMQEGTQAKRARDARDDLEKRDADDVAVQADEAESTAPKAQAAPEPMAGIPENRDKSPREEAFAYPRAQSESPRPSAPVTLRTLSFLLGGTTPIVVEAPDSIRVVHDKGGGVILIFTSDGLIRVRLGQD